MAGVESEIGSGLFSGSTTNQPNPYQYTQPTPGNSTGQASGSQGWLNPQNITAGAAAAAGIFSLFQKNDEQKEIKAACGSKPLFGQAKKDKYQQCANNFMMASLASRQAPVNLAPQSNGMSTALKAGLIVGGSLLLIIIIIMVIFLVKLQNKKGK